jgi:hypothetical protein
MALPPASGSAGELGSVVSSTHQVLFAAGVVSARSRRRFLTFV